jgi:simple sugar transport system permease protein
MSGRRFQLTRMHIFSLFFLAVGLWMALRVPGSFPADTISKMSVGLGAEAPVWEAPTRAVLQLVALLYLAGGVLGLVNRWPRLSFALLLLDGILIFPAILIAAAAGKQTNMLTMLAESLRLATPIVIGATAGIWSERSGVVNIAIEGMMLTGACFGFVTFFFLEPAMPDATNTALLIAVLVAVFSGALMSLLHAWLSITFKTDQIVSGTVINILAIGLTSFVRREFLLSTRAGRVTLPSIAIPGLSQIPIVGEVLFNNKPVFYMMFVLLVVTHVVLFYTRLGLRMRSVGEHPLAADTVGINVFFTRYRSVLISGMIAGLGGAWFSLETVGGFDDLMTGGRGFIALAAMIFGKWNPAGAFGGGLLFGFADALGTRFQILNVPVPPQWLQMLPFLTTMVVLAGLIGRAIPPAADGQPYEKQ